MTPGAVAVVIPARDEEDLLPACLDSVATAVDAVHAAHPQVRTRVVVVLDACRDGSAGVVAGREGVATLSTDAGCVGVARSEGVEAAAAWAATRAGPKAASMPGATEMAKATAPVVTMISLKPP